MSTSKVTNKADLDYQNLLQDILKNGTKSLDRTGTGTKKVFGRMLKFDLSKGFPLLTSKRVWFHGVKEELLWFIRGERNLKNLVLKNVNIWNEWPFQRYLVATKQDKKYKKYTPLWEEKMKEFVEKIKTDSKFSKKYGEKGFTDRFEIVMLYHFLAPLSTILLKSVPLFLSKSWLKPVRRAVFPTLLI